MGYSGLFKGRQIADYMLISMLRDKLKDFLRAFEDGRVVTKEDVDGFLEQMAEKR